MPYSAKHGIPTVQKYREHRGEIDERQKQAEASQHSDEDDSKARRAFESVKSIFKGEDEHVKGSPYPVANRNTSAIDHEPSEHDSGIPQVPGQEDSEQHSHHDQDATQMDQGGQPGNKEKSEKSATEEAVGTLDPRQKRKAMKHKERTDGGREVTDPVTHLPVTIRDSTEKDMKRAPENELSPGEQLRTSTGLSGASKSSTQLGSEQEELQKDADGMQRVFPPPAFDDIKAELVRSYQVALSLGIGSTIVLATLAVLAHQALDSMSHKSSSYMRGSPKALFVSLFLVITVAASLGFAAIILVRGWLGKKVESIWADEVWDAAREDEAKLNTSNGHLPESVGWLNSLLSSVWPLVNPDLFTSLADTLEDVMQASLPPKFIRMVSVEDIGQGSESIRILGIRWLPTGAANQSVDEKGKLKGPSNDDDNDHTNSSGAEEASSSQDEDDDDETSKNDRQQSEQREQEQQAIREGMEAEQGDFVNVELAFAYRARSCGKSLKAKAKNAHLFLKFYVTSGVAVPVWVELKGLIGTMRLRLQLTPDPPFFSLCTLTLLGQPRADLSCVPLSKHLPNLMDVPFISSFVQTSIDAALAEYVAPKSLTLDLKDMLVGDDFKKDTVARGVIVVLIKEARGFKEGDTGVLNGGSSDSYVTTSWGKFGKTLSATRVIAEEQTPIWHEWAYLLVTPDELNASEILKLQLWDSDKRTADDDLGRVEVDLRELMHSEKTKNRMCDREDRFVGENAEEKMPGTLLWSVGFYTKRGVTDEQLAKQSEDKSINSKEDLKQSVSDTAERKLREAKAHDEEGKEIHHQKVQDYKAREDSLVISSPPDPNYPCGILSIQIHNITGLEVTTFNRRDDACAKEDEAEQADDLPSSTCSIILNHSKIYRTRTKPKTANPFFNAGTERPITDWTTAEVMISVHDSRERENDALLGMVFLPLGKVFGERSQMIDTWPLVGGVGFGRIRISMVFRSVELQLPPEVRGWSYGTLEIKSPVKAKDGLSQDVMGHRMKVYSNLTRVKLSAEKGEWREKHGKNTMFLACRTRYSMPLMVEWRASMLGPDSTTAFAVFWLQDIPDEEQKTISLKVWKGGKENLKRAKSCYDYQGLDDDERPLGEIEMTIKFWRGLSGYHKQYAKKEKSGNLRDVIEVLDTANDEENSQAEDEDGYSNDESDNDIMSNGPPRPTDGPTSHTSTKKKLQTHTNQSTSSLSSNDTRDQASTFSQSSKASRNPFKKAKQKINEVMESHNDADDGERGIVKSAKDYKDHRKQLHRKHRGVMQWKGVRTAEWAVGGLRRGLAGVGGEDGVAGKMVGMKGHGEKGGAGVETEV